MRLDDVHRGIHKHKKRQRVGRGPGSGHGKTAGRGNKGQGQLAGWSAAGIFQGGQMPLVRRIPKRGFHNRFAKQVAVVNVGDLEAAFAAGDLVTFDAMIEKGLVKGYFDVLKVLGDGELTKKLTVRACCYSAAARRKIEQAGGEAVIWPEPVEPEGQAKE
jgi:large subunit ribosomal protein L15